MLKFHSIEALPLTDDDGNELSTGGRAVTIGKFDGLHLGHQALIRTLVELAQERNLLSTVVTFEPSPLQFFDPLGAPKSLVGSEHKIELLAASGIDEVAVLPFNRELSLLSPEEFVQQVLIDGLNTKLALVGHDFRFGYKGAGTLETLIELGERYGFEVVTMTDYSVVDGVRVSSTRIRELMAEGDVGAVRQLLGRNPSVRGRVVHGAKRGRELGFPTANLEPEAAGQIPADGVYAGWLTVDGVRYPAAISVGTNPTFGADIPRAVESYVLDQSFDIYNKSIEVEFSERIRFMVAFTGIDALIAQMTDDVRKVREILRGSESA